MPTRPATPLLALHTTDTDAPAFIDRASRLITASAVQQHLDRVYAVHIDNWFGARWLGFCGKILGAAGVRNRTLKASLTLPPFHPHRVLSARGHYCQLDGTYIDLESLDALHPEQTSSANIHNCIELDTLYAWYSGNSQNNQRGVVMIYSSTWGGEQAFYVTFDGDCGWRVDRPIAISRVEVERLMASDSITDGVN